MNRERERVTRMSLKYQWEILNQRMIITMMLIIWIQWNVYCVLCSVVTTVLDTAVSKTRNWLFTMYQRFSTWNSLFSIKRNLEIIPAVRTKFFFYSFSSSGYVLWTRPGITKCSVAGSYSNILWSDSYHR